MGLCGDAFAAIGNGAVIKTSNKPACYPVCGSKKHAIPDYNTFLACGWDKKLQVVSDAELAALPTGAAVPSVQTTDPIACDRVAGISLSAPVALRDGLLVKCASSPSAYVISGGLRHPIENAQLFEALGFKWNNLVTLADTELYGIPLGDPIA